MPGALCGDENLCIWVPSEEQSLRSNHKNQFHVIIYRLIQRGMSVLKLRWIGNYLWMRYANPLSGSTPRAQLQLECGTILYMCVMCAWVKICGNFNHCVQIKTLWFAATVRIEYINVLIHLEPISIARVHMQSDIEAEMIRILYWKALHQLSHFDFYSHEFFSIGHFHFRSISFDCVSFSLRFFHSTRR